MMIDNRDALLKERELARKRSLLLTAVSWYVREPAVLPPVLKRSMKK